MDKKLERMKELIDILNNASKLYYQFSTSIMTDYEYDRLYDELVELENETNMVLSNSPTINVEPEILSSLEKREHLEPMLSLTKTKLVDELEAFLSDKEGLLSWKLDGLTIVLTYQNGKLQSGVTRGNGIIGEVVTENVKRFKNVPLNISFKGNLVIRGEAVIKYSDFEKMNEDIKDDEEQFKNPRNLCSGSVRQLDSNITAKRNVNLLAFALISAEGKKFETKKEQFDWLTSLGFDVVEHFLVTKDNLSDRVLDFKNRIMSNDIPSDGLVLTYNDVVYSNSLGSTAKYPRHSMAFKWQDETYETKLIDVDWSVSRTGLINPVAVFEPVDIDGTTVTRASLHNISILKGLELGLNDKVLVYKANMIIPQIAGNLTKSNNLIIPDSCPVCKHNSEIRVINDIKYLYCSNELCYAKLLKRLSLFTSRNAMNIEGISDAILNKLISEDLVKEYKDLYHLNEYKDIIESFEGFGEKSFQNLYNSIEKSRNVKLANFIYALGIPEIGFARAKLICNSFNNDFEKVRNLSFEDLSNIYGIGEIIAKEWIDTFSNEEFLSTFNNVLSEINFIDEKSSKDKKLLNKVFVITGNVINFKNRDELVEFIEDNGGKVISAISSNVNYLINNDVTSLSTKNKKAKELNIDIISEEDLLNLVK